MYVYLDQLKSVKHIHASGKRENLFRMIKNPVTRHLPVNARKIGKIVIQLI